MIIHFIFPEEYGSKEIKIENPFDFIPRKGDFVAGFFEDDVKCFENNFEVESIMIQYDIGDVIVFLKKEI